MTLLGKKFEYLDDDEQDKDGYKVPAVFRQNPKELSLKKSIIISTILHPTVVGAIWLMLIILTILGITIPLFDRPKPQPKDIEFVLVDKEATPINKNTKFRSDKNSRAGGKHDPKRKVSMPQPAAPKAAPQKKASSPPKAAPAPKQPKRAAQHPPAAKKAVSQPQESLPFFAPRPNVKPSLPRPTSKPKGDFAIPIPKSTAPKLATPSGGPVTGSTQGTNSGSSSGSGSRPSPSFSPSTSGSSSGSGSAGGRFSGSYGSGGGNIGNPGPGNPKGAPGIDAIREPDFGPYMRELQRRIKMNWDPPKGNESKRVVLLFAISRDGRLLNVKVHKSSGLPVADRAAISAVQLTAPFKPLPPEYKGNSVDIQFTFDYNVFGASRY